MGLWKLVEERAALTPHKTMIVDDYERTITFADFRNRAERVAQGLVNLGVKPGQTVAWQLPTRLETVLLLTALSRLDVRQVPILTLYREREVGFLLKETRPEFVFAPGVLRGFDYAGMMERLVRDNGLSTQVHVAYDEMPEADPVNLPAATTLNDDLERWIFATSGTTSEPKGVCHSDRSLQAAAAAFGKATGITGDDVCTVNFPVAHGGGPVAFMQQLIAGFTAVYTEVFQPATAVALYKRHHVTVAGTGLPFYLAYLGEQRKQPGQKIIPTLRLITGGGAPKPPTVYFHVKEEIGVPILHAWGMTEGLILTHNRPDNTDEQRAYTDGRPVEGVELRIRDAEGRDVHAGQDGEIFVKGPMMFKRFTSASLTAESIDQQGFYRTGDYGRLREDGQLVITGRIKDIIIRKGENISAAEIENVLHKHSKVAEVAVVGIADEERGERACAVVVSRGDERLTFDEMVKACQADQVARFKIPEQLEFVSELPRNSTMKILKTKLREEMAKRPWTQQ